MKRFATLLLVLALACGCSAPKAEQGRVRHIILWTLQDNLPESQKLELMESTAADIAALQESVPGAVSLKMLYEGRLESSNCDFMFDFVFESEEALAAFAENPDHLAAAARIKPYISGRACLDIAD